MSDVLCPNCSHLIRIKTEPVKGQFVSCPSCNGVFNLVALNPLKLERFDLEPNSADNIKESANSKSSKNRRQQYRHHDTEDDNEEDRFEKYGRKARKRNRYFESE